MAERLVGVAARLLPRLARDRYREEWLADLGGAEEEGVSRAGIVIGALTTAVTISRTAPALTGLTLSDLFIHRLRMAAGLLGSAGVLALAYSAYGGYTLSEIPGAGGLAVAGRVQLGAAVALALTGGITLLGALAVAVRARRVGVAIALLLVPVALAAIFIAAPFLVLGFAGPIVAIGLCVGIVMAARGGLPVPRGRRLAMAGSFGIAALALCAVSILHVAVWNPLARVPGRTLDEIYAQLAAAGEATGVGVWLGVQAFVTALAVVAVVVLSVVPRRRPVLATARRLVTIGLLLLAGTTALGFVGAASMMMGLADTFLTSGGDAVASGPLLSIAGQAAFVGALLVATVRPATPRAAALPPPTSPARA